MKLDSTVAAIHTTKRGVVVTLSDDTKLAADYALCTFSLGVLQHNDVEFVPPLPGWKQEAIHSMTMVRQFPASPVAVSEALNIINRERTRRFSCSSHTGFGSTQR